MSNSIRIFKMSMEEYVEKYDIKENWDFPTSELNYLLEEYSGSFALIYNEEIEEYRLYEMKFII